MSMNVAIATLRSVNHYYEDGNIVLKVEQVLYKLYRPILVRHSVVLRELLSIPTPDQEEGQSDDKPIELPGILANEFDCLMDCLWLNFSEITLWTVPRLLALLKMAKHWIVPAGIDMAIALLSEHPEVDDALRLHLAVMYDIKDWYHVVLRGLLTTPTIGDIPQTSLRLINPSVLTCLVHHRRKILSTRICVVSVPTYIPAGICLYQNQCKSAWEASWRAVMFDYVVSANDTLLSAKTRLEYAIKTSRICKLCGAINLVVSDSILQNEHTAIEGGVDELKEKLGVTRHNDDN